MAGPEDAQHAAAGARNERSSDAAGEADARDVALEKGNARSAEATRAADSGQRGGVGKIKVNALGNGILGGVSFTTGDTDVEVPDDMETADSIAVGLVERAGARTRRSSE